MPIERPPLLPNEPPVGDLASERYEYGTRWQQHPGFGLKARTLVAIYRQAEAGFPQLQCDMFDDLIERDAHLRSQLASRLLSVAGKSWIIQPGGDAAADKRAATILDTILRKHPLNFLEARIHQLRSTWFGWSASEIKWEYDGNSVVPVWFANPEHRRFNFDKDDSPLLVTDVPKIYNDAVGEPLAPGSWWYVRSPLHHLAARAGLMRTAAWWSMFKSMSVTDWLVLAAIYGVPYRMGKYKAGAPDPVKKVLAQAVRELGTDGASIMSDDCEIVIQQIEAGRAGDVHGAITALCNAEISKLISGGTLTSGEGTGSGSHALGKVHENQSFNNVLFDAEMLALSFEQSISTPFLRWNGFPSWTQPPRLKVHVTREMDPVARAQVASLLANNLGLLLDEEQIRQEHQFKAPVGAALKGTAIKQVEIKSADAGAGEGQ